MLSLEIVRQLYERGLRPGNYWGGDFDYWPDEGCRAVLDPGGRIGALVFRVNW
jgi:hypothetical protein